MQVNKYFTYTCLLACSFASLCEMCDKMGVKVSASHRSGTSAWGFAEALSSAHVEADKELLSTAPFLGFSLDESTSIDSVQYLSIEAFSWLPRQGRLSLFLELRPVTEVDAVGILGAIQACLQFFNITDCSRRIVGLAADGASVFQGQHNGVFTRATRTLSPFAVSTHCPAHRVNLAATDLKSPILSTLTNMSHAISNHFSKSSKRQNAYQLVQQSLQLPAHKFLYGCATRWLSELSCYERMWEQYAGLLVYGHSLLDNDRNPDIVYLCNALCNLDVCLQLPLVILVLSELNSLCKVLQREDLYLVQVADAVNHTVSQLQKHFLLPTKYVDPRYFSHYNILAVSADSPLQWDENDLVYRAGAEKFIMESCPPGSRRPVPVDSMQVYNRVLKTAKDTASDMAKMVVDGLCSRFPSTLVLEALSIIQLEYWKDERLNKTSYNKCVDCLCELYGLPRSTSDGSDGGEKVHDALVDADKLKHQACFFYEYMLSMRYEVQTTEQLWLHVDSDIAVSSRISEIHTVAHIVLSMPASSVNNERAFSLMSIIKDALRNKMGPHHLNCTMRIARSRFTLDSFPYERAYQQWASASERYLV